MTSTHVGGMLGTRVDIRGRAVHLVRRTSLSQRLGYPTFLIEAGCGWHAAMYPWLIDALTNHGAVIAYDRSGLGRSERSPAALDGLGRAQELQELVETLGVSDPFVLIGHSIAALYLRIFLRQRSHPASALVLIDPTHTLVHQLLPGRLPLAEYLARVIARGAMLCGARRLPFPLRRSEEPPWDSLPQDCRKEIEETSRSPVQAIAEAGERAMLAIASQQAQACGALGDLPLLVLTAGTRTPYELRYARNPECFMDTWMLLQRDIAALSTCSVHRVFAGAGHGDIVTVRHWAEAVTEEIADFTAKFTQPKLSH